MFKARRKEYGIKTIVYSNFLGLGRVASASKHFDVGCDGDRFDIFKPLIAAALDSI